ncbi:MAG TPA: CAP domain-containing protein, partial [Spirochaetota bacterium]|nr:CAP domain-containing protein [Spirochaetota bacterium]
KYKLAGPEGHPIPAGEYGNWGVLLGKIGGGKIFTVSSGVELTSDADGILYLFPNKGKFLIEKESGSLRVIVEGGQKKEDFISTLPVNSKKIIFDPKEGVLNTGLFLNENESVEIYAFGSWTMWDGVYKETNAEGHTFEFQSEGVSWGKLYGGIGSSYGQFNEIFSIGETTKYLTSQSGILSLYPYLGNYVSVKNGNMEIYIVGGRDATGDDIKIVDEKAKNSSANMALTRLNEYRKTLKIPELEFHPILSQTAFEHAKYIAVNDSFSRDQEEGKNNFTGITFEDRLKKFGYEGRAREMFCQVDSITSSVDIFFDGVYHRMRLMDPDLKYLGYGNYKNNERSIHVFDLGYLSEEEKKTEWEKIEFPAIDSKDNKVSWDGVENPDPIPPGNEKPYGFPITLLLKEQIVSVSIAELTNDEGKSIESFIITPENDINNKQINSVVMIPKKSLEYGKKYSVNIVLKLVNSGEKTYNWSFDTAAK